MTGETVYNTLLSYIRKDKRGLSFTVDDFNRLATTVDKRVLIAFMSRFEEDIEITSHAGFLKILDYPINLSAGIGYFPTNYFKIMGDPYYINTAYNPTTVFIDVVTSEEFTYRQRDYLTQATLKNPLCIIGSENSSHQMQIKVYPTTITTIYANYVRDTVSPYLDYYVNDSTLQYTFLTQGQTFTVPTGSTYRDGVTRTGTSLTKDFEWDLHELPWIIAYFMQAVGIALPDELMIQIGKVDSSEIQSGAIW